MIGHLLNRVLTQHRRSFVDDGAGGRAATWQQIGTVAARVSQPSATEQTVAAQAGARLTHAVYLAPGTDVARGDELRGDGQTLQVHATVAPSKAAYVRADCELVQAEQEA